MTTNPVTTTSGGMGEEALSMVEDDALRAYFNLHPEAAIPQPLLRLRERYVACAVFGGEREAKRWFADQARRMMTPPPVTNERLLREIQDLRAALSPSE